MARACARAGAQRPAHLPLRRPRRRRRSRSSPRNLRDALPRPADRRRLLAAVPRAVRRRAGRAIAARINAARPDVVWVGIGVPKQEKWMAAMRERLDAPVLVGVGAAFDFHAGLDPAGAAWMQRRGLEWLFRLLQEPRRLWRRYARYNPRFVAGFARQWARPSPRPQRTLASRHMSAGSAYPRRRDRRPRPRRPAARALASPTAASRVLGIDNDAERLQAVAAGRMPFQETGTDELIERVHASGRLRHLRARRRRGAGRRDRADARHAVVQPHRDRHARHPLRARRPAAAPARPATRSCCARRSRPARPSSSPATSSASAACAPASTCTSRTCPSGSRPASSCRRSTRCRASSARSAARRRASTSRACSSASTRRSCRRRRCRPSWRRSGRTSCATRTSRCPTC